MLVAAVVGVFFWQGGKQEPTPPAGRSAAGDLAAIPTVRFTDITREAGISFVHVNGAAGEKLLPETMGGGVAFFDCDGDGDQDLLFVNGTRWPWDSKSASAGKPATAAVTARIKVKRLRCCMVRLLRGWPERVAGRG